MAAVPKLVHLAAGVMPSDSWFSFDVCEALARYGLSLKPHQYLYAEEDFAYNLLKYWQSSFTADAILTTMLYYDRA